MSEDQTIWDAKQCAEWLGISYSTFIQKRQHAEGFPARIPLGKQHPRWRAQEVKDWSNGYKAAA